MLKKVLGMVAQQEDHITSHLANQAILELQNKKSITRNSHVRMLERRQVPE